MKDNPADEATPLCAAQGSVDRVFPLRLVWSAQLHPVGDHSPWDRLRDRLLWDAFVEWLREDVHLESVDKTAQTGC